MLSWGNSSHNTTTSYLLFGQIDLNCVAVTLNWVMPRLWWMSVVSIRGNNGHSLVTATARIHHNQLWYKPKLRMGKLNFNSDRGAVTDVSIKSDWRTDTRLTSPHPPPSLSFLSISCLTKMNCLLMNNSRFMITLTAEFCARSLYSQL